MEDIPASLKEVGIVEALESSVPLDTPFYNAQGDVVLLKQFFNKDKAVILNLAYYNCPMLCHLVTGGLANGMQALSFPLGSKFDIVTVSIDPRDTQETAVSFQNKYHKQVLLGDRKDWSFLYGSQPSIQALADSVGFHYKFNDKTGEFAHSAGIIILTPDGKVSSYLYGIEFRPFDLKLAVLGAINKKFTSTVDRVLLFCYNYDPQSRKYVLYAEKLMRIGGVITLIFLIGLFLKLRKLGPHDHK
jgi:protein SCO1